MADETEVREIEPDVAAAIDSNVQLVVEQFSEFSDKPMEPNRGGVEFLDGFIAHNRESWDEGTRGRLTQVLGSFLGAALVAEGGVWVEADHGPAVKFAPDILAYPFNKVVKHMEEGEDQSVLAFYDSAVALSRETN